MTTSPVLALPMAVSGPGEVRVFRSYDGMRGDVVSVCWPDDSTDEICVSGRGEASEMMIRLKGALMAQGWRVRT